MLTIDNLYKSYGKKEVLTNLNLSFQQGNIYGIVGENGAGKSTFFKCLLGLENYQGKISYGEKVIRHVAGFLPTHPFFLSKLTGKEYLQLVCNARNIPVKDWANRNIFALPLEQYAATYSTGMKKKLALTGVLLQKNEIFVLDEPFNGVDIQSNILIIELLQQLKKRNKIVLLSSHIFSTLSDSCDFIHYLKNGEIIKSVGKDDFDSIELEMKGTGIGNRLDNLDI